MTPIDLVITGHRGCHDNCDHTGLSLHRRSRAHIKKALILTSHYSNEDDHGIHRGGESGKNEASAGDC